MSMVLTSFCRAYWQLILAQGVAFGIGGGLLYLPAASIISQYFDKKKGIAFGIASIGSSLGEYLYRPTWYDQLTEFDFEAQSYTLYFLHGWSRLSALDGLHM